MVDPPTKVTVDQEQGQLHSRTIHVLDRSTHSHRETSLGRSPSHEAHTVAPKVTPAGTGGFGKSYPVTQFPPPALRLVVRRKKYPPGTSVASPRPCPSTVYRCLKRRFRHTLRGIYCKRRLVKTGKSSPHKFSRVESSLPSPKELRASLQGSGCVNSNGQHHYGVLHQQGGRYEIRLSVCPPLETPVLVPSQGNSPASKAHSRSLERNCPGTNK